MNSSEIDLDISTYLIPLSASEIFNNNKKTALEIGFGEGEFITELADKYPEWNFIGIEVKYYRYLKALKLAARHDLRNLRLIHIEASIAVEQIFCKEIFDMVYINFPDPWPKEKHTKHRIINYEFLKKLYRIMKKDGIVEFVTDSEEYAVNTSHFFRGFSGFEKKEESAEIDSERPVTRFQQEFNRQSRKFYFQSYIKTDK